LRREGSEQGDVLATIATLLASIDEWLNEQAAVFATIATWLASIPEELSEPSD
jgi:hypothetical protein